MKIKIAIITGGGSGMGFAIAEKFVENNISTIIAGRRIETLQAAKKKLGDLCVCNALRFERSGKYSCICARGN